jgi:hypothetical protein
MKHIVGWCFVVEEGTASFPPPERFQLPKDSSPMRRGHYSCPAVRAAALGNCVIRSPFSMRLRFRRRDDYASFYPVYPFTTLSEVKLSEMLRVEPRESWRGDDIPVIQFPSPYMFVSDEKMEIEQCSAILADSSSLNWRLIPGRFDIFGWQRPLNWAFEWDTRNGDLVIRAGEPLYHVRFYDEHGRLITSPNLVRVELDGELKRRFLSATGVTAIQRGTAALIKKSSINRKRKLVQDIDNKDDSNRLP